MNNHIEVIALRRGGGKTQGALLLSQQTEAIIVCATESQAGSLKNRAKQANFWIPDPIPIHKVKQIVEQNPEAKFILEDVLYLLRETTGLGYSQIEGCTVSTTY